MDLTVNSKLVIPQNEIQWRFSRSSGAGGQNVNKVSSRVEIIFNLKNSKVFTPFQKNCINNRLKNKVINGYICIAVQDKRTQYQNRELALARLVSAIRYGLKPPEKKRKETKPTKASQRRRLDSKKKRGEVKKKRQSRVEDI
ncbi:alternative ribosome rescue aminoacyl-tRNA hydrolase ArfB [Prochlorococcus sp. MIT 1223]|uniref:alternative ribosome rescue aminoacyl-tRNA hydrolase ArfB n=1 Tax=Prochlorococcus sp. MIT 1223 TaxID=3096217 RepID=UPI002A75018A|nr:alternative ribosome rescue aminoacyl-tRNA hydrolase ArfB [Prochlorococcus sp. MIT 1223]